MSIDGFSLDVEMIVPEAIPVDQQDSSVPYRVGQKRGMAEPEPVSFLNYWVDWFIENVESVRPTSRAGYASLLYDNNVTTEKRLLNKLQTNKEWLVQIGIEELDSIDIVDYFFPSGAQVMTAPTLSKVRLFLLLMKIETLPLFAYYSILLVILNPYSHDLFPFPSHYFERLSRDWRTI